MAMLKTVLCVFLLWFFCGVTALFGQKTEEPLLLADEKLFGERYIVCRGNAELFWQTYHVLADEIVYDTQERTVRASGRVALNDRDNVISGDTFSIDLKEMKGEMSNVYGMAPPSISFRTDKLIQTDQQTFLFDNLIFSSCGQLKPDWSIRSQNGIIKKDRYIEMKHLVFRINLFGGLPILYLPYLRYPIQKDGRSTGFLFPQIGTSAQKGFYVRNAFFWDIASNADITTRLDWFGLVGTGLEANLRYLFHGGTKGEIRYYHFFHRQDSEFRLADKDSDYQLEAFHDQRLPFLDTRLSVNINRESNPTLRQLFSDHFFMAHYSTFFSRVRAESRILKNLTFAISASRNETYFSAEKKANITEYLPSMSLTLSQQKLFVLPGRLNVSISAEQVSRMGGIINPADHLYDTDVKTRRLIFKPKYTLAVFDTPWMNLSLDMASQFQIYSNRRDPVTQMVVDEPLSLSANTFSINMQGLKFERIIKGRNKTLQHLIYPEITFSYSSTFDEDLQKQVIKVDNQGFSPYSYVSFSLHNYLRQRNHSGKDRSRREFIALTLGIDYYLDPEEAHYGRKIDDEFVPWGPANGTFKISPSQALSFSTSLSYNLYRRYPTYSMISMQAGTDSSPFNGSFYLSQSKDPYYQDNLFNQTSLGSELRIDPEGWPFRIKGQLNYNITMSLLTAGFMMDLKLQCWSASFGINQQLIFRSGEWVADLRFQFGVRLGHLNMVQDLLSMRDR